VEFQGYIEKLRDDFISHEYADEIKMAKQEFIVHGGELGNEIEGYEEALDIFFDWYLFERPQLQEGLTPLILLSRNTNISEEARKIYLDFTNYVHSIFTIKKSASHIKVMDIFTKNKYLVTEPPLAILEKGDMVEARLLLFRGEYRFSGAFCFYPKSIYPIMKTKAAEARKGGAENFVPLIRQLRKLKTVWSRCSRMDIHKIHTLMEEGRLA